MWIVTRSLRLSYAQVLACSEKDLLLDFDTWVSTAAASSTLSGKHTRAASWKLAWKKARWLQRLSGAAISPNCGESDFAAWWIASLPASHAKTCLLPADAQALTASAQGSSSKSSESPLIAVRGSCFWRTSQASLLPPPPLWTRKKASSTSAQPPESWENWPTSGGMRNGSLFQRPTWAPATAGLDGSALPGATWPTPDVCSAARDMSKVDPERQKRADTKVTIGLPTAAAAWPTPSSFLNEGTAEQYIARKQRTQATVGTITDLSIVASAWPTPAARDYRSESSGGGLRDQTPERIQGPDVELHGHPFFAPGPADERWAGIIAERPWLAPALSIEEEHSAQAAFAAAESLLRGEPDGLANGLDFDNRQQRLKCIGNGVVALQAATAFVVLARRAGIGATELRAAA